MPVKSENAIGIAEAMYAMYEGQFKSLGGGGGRALYWSPVPY